MRKDSMEENNVCVLWICRKHLMESYVMFLNSW